jgi:hypothetical protein
VSPAERSATAIKRLASVLESELEAVEATAQTIGRIVEVARTPEGEWLRTRALAFELERLYTACEALLLVGLPSRTKSAPT